MASSSSTRFRTRMRRNNSSQRFSNARSCRSSSSSTRTITSITLSETAVCESGRHSPRAAQRSRLDPLRETPAHRRLSDARTQGARRRSIAAPSVDYRTGESSLSRLTRHPLAQPSRAYRRRLDRDRSRCQGRVPRRPLLAQHAAALSSTPRQSRGSRRWRRSRP